MGAPDPNGYRRLKIRFAYVVVAVWSLVLLIGLTTEVAPEVVYSVQAVMVIVTGGLWADRLLRRGDDGE